MLIKTLKKSDRNRKYKVLNRPYDGKEKIESEVFKYKVLSNLSILLIPVKEKLLETLRLYKSCKVSKLANHLPSLNRIFKRTA
mgnify:CR=1 FL=1